jgi:SAM-dependent MidA family methyltransferase
MIKNLVLSLKIPFGKKVILLPPKISNLFSEIIAIWIFHLGNIWKPKNFNIVELGPGDGSLTKFLLRSFKKFPEFNSLKKFFI